MAGNKSDISQSFASRAPLRHRPWYVSGDAKKIWYANTICSTDTACTVLTLDLPDFTRVTMDVADEEDPQDSPEILVTLDGGERFCHSIHIAFESKAYTKSNTHVFPDYRSRRYGSSIFANFCRLGPRIGIERYEFKASHSLGAPTWARFHPVIDPKNLTAVGTEILRRLEPLYELREDDCNLGISRRELQLIADRAKALNNGIGTTEDVAFIAGLNDTVGDHIPALLNIIAENKPLEDMTELVAPNLTWARYFLGYQDYDAYIDLTSPRALKRVEEVISKPSKLRAPRPL